MNAPITDGHNIAGKIRPPLEAASSSKRDSVSTFARRVLASELRGRRIKALFLALEARLAAPRALQIVADAESELAQAVYFKLDPIAVLECVQAAVVGASRQDVASLERVQCARPFDAARDLVRHVGGVEVLPQHA